VARLLSPTTIVDMEIISSSARIGKKEYDAVTRGRVSPDEKSGRHWVLPYKNIGPSGAEGQARSPTLIKGRHHAYEAAKTHHPPGPGPAFRAGEKKERQLGKVPLVGPRYVETKSSCETRAGRFNGIATRWRIVKPAGNHHLLEAIKHGNQGCEDLLHARGRLYFSGLYFAKVGRRQAAMCNVIGVFWISFRGVMIVFWNGGLRYLRGGARRACHTPVQRPATSRSRDGFPSA